MAETIERESIAKSLKEVINLDVANILHAGLEKLKVFLTHDLDDSVRDGIVEYTLSTMNIETNTVLQEIKFRCDSYDEARLATKSYKSLLLESFQELQIQI
ncbi:hypothetical protein [Sporosarcina sp. FSL K6-2383]|uniref:hypothetical protein n=1 Tax=Sporosarcina sp. FSL K6-2383 TaxID=2921556 RepID=UPI00315AD884